MFFSSLCFLYHENELIEQTQDYVLLLRFSAALTRSCPGSTRSQLLMVSTVWSGRRWFVVCFGSGYISHRWNTPSAPAAAQFGQGQVQRRPEESETSWFIS